MVARRQAARCVFDSGERLGKQFVQRAFNRMEVLDSVKARFPLLDFSPQILIAETLVFQFDLINPFDGRLQTLEKTRVFRTDYFFEQPLDHGKIYANAFMGLEEREWLEGKHRGIC